MGDSPQPQEARRWWPALIDAGFILFGPVIILSPLLVEQPAVLTGSGAPILWVLIGLVFVLWGVIAVQGRRQDRAAERNTAAGYPARLEPTWKKVLRLGINVLGIMVSIYYINENGLNIWWLFATVGNALVALLTLRDLIGKWQWAG